MGPVLTLDTRSIARAGGATALADDRVTRDLEPKRTAGKGAVVMVSLPCVDA